jgi:hypothetical protein
MGRVWQGCLVPTPRRPLGSPRRQDANRRPCGPSHVAQLGLHLLPDARCVACAHRGRQHRRCNGTSQPNPPQRSGCGKMTRPAVCLQLHRHHHLLTSQPAATLRDHWWWLHARNHKPPQLRPSNVTGQMARACVGPRQLVAHAATDSLPRWGYLLGHCARGPVTGDPQCNPCSLQRRGPSRGGDPDLDLLYSCAVGKGGSGFWTLSQSTRSAFALPDLKRPIATGAAQRCAAPAALWR